MPPAGGGADARRERQARALRETDDDQLPREMGDQVYSLCIGDEDGQRTVQRQTSLGELESVSPRS